MGARVSLALFAFLAGCAGVEGDINRAEFREFFLDLTRGKDRGYPAYRKTYEKAIQRTGSRTSYQYTAPAHVSHFLVHKTVRSLGGTKIVNSDYLAGAVDLLLDVVALDPTAATRAAACHQLGRVLLTLPPNEDERLAPDAGADQRIHEAVGDLFQFQKALQQGQRVKESAVLDRLRALDREHPSHLLGAREMMRALAGPPVSGRTEAGLRAEAERVVPRLARKCILVALRQVACGGGPDYPPDPSPMVRAHAAQVLARVGAPVARDRAAERLWDPIDPPERDPDVQRALLRYLGAVGGPRALEACLRRLEDPVDSGVRFHAQQALRRMTGVTRPPTRRDWADWRERHPAWQLPAESAEG